MKACVHVNSMAVNCKMESSIYKRNNKRYSMQGITMISSVGNINCRVASLMNCRAGSLMSNYCRVASLMKCRAGSLMNICMY